MNRPHACHTLSSALRVLAVLTVIMTSTLSAGSGRGQQTATWPWSDKNLSPDQRADLVIGRMTPDEKITLVHGIEGGLAQQHSLGGAGYVPGLPRLGIPALQMTDGRSGVANIGSRGRYATALPSALANAASWDLDGAYEYGALLGKEVRDLGFNVSLGGTSNIIREPRNGRNFECLGEDPILEGKMLGRELRGTQDQQVIGNINRFAVNDQETGRFIGNSVIDRRAMQETDLLAFRIAIQESNVGTVMCAYNRLNGVYACEDPYLLTDVLKKSWNYKGWVMTDWGAAHSTVASALAGLDQEMPTGKYFGDRLKGAVDAGKVTTARLNDMVHRILRTEFALGVIDNPPDVRPVNPFSGADVAERVEERGIVLLKNNRASLPLDASAVKSIAVIGAHADTGVLSGAGSDQVDAAGAKVGGWAGVVWQPSSPLKAIGAKAPNARVAYDPGTDATAAARLASESEVAIVFVQQHTTEGRDVPSLSLPDGQDEFVRRVAAANPRSIVVLETGGVVTMPWVDDVNAILEVWYPGIRGGEAIANVLFGDVNPSGRLPVTFPRSEADLPRVHVPGMSAEGGGATARAKAPASFDIDYTEGAAVGYRWFEAEHRQPLFPFGFGLSYTVYSYTRLKATPGRSLTVSFDVTNTGTRAGAEVAQVYVMLPPSAREPFKRLVAWQKVHLAPGETKAVTLTVEPLYLSIFDVDKSDWDFVPGEYKVYVGGSSQNTPLTATVSLQGGQH
ncbi:MAG TPA: glycoside hydrolase family 3 C-terminal domain-containing protein [Terriglobia bacterium]|nr:glycoside hydrolase family 3 C-terminal domain-containing protein [Terriglobia bacterium]